jgi:hypothetical protein
MAFCRSQPIRANDTCFSGSGLQPFEWHRLRRVAGKLRPAQLKGFDQMTVQFKTIFLSAHGLA